MTPSLISSHWSSQVLSVKQHVDKKRSQQIRCGGAQLVLWVTAAGEHIGSKGPDGLRTDLLLCQAVWCLQMS